MRNIVVSAGRNVGDKPMPDKQWAAFRLDILSLFPQRLFYGVGVGTYEGTVEESFTVIAPCDTGDWHMESSVNLRTRYIRATLQTLARQYGQECIAMTIGEPDLVTP